MTERIDTKALLEKWGKTREFDGTYPIPLSEWWDALTQEVAEHEADRKRLEQWEAEAQDKAHPKVRPMTHLENAYMDLEKKLATAQARIEALEKAIAALRPVYGGVCKVCGNVVSQEGNDIGLDYIEGHAEDCEFAALAAET